MEPDFEHELDVAIAEGVLGADEACVVRKRALAEGKSPLSLLRAEGRLSEDTFASLCARAPALRDTDVPAPTREPSSAAVELAPEPPVGNRAGPAQLDDTAVLGDPGAPVHPADLEGFPAAGWQRFHPVRLLGQGGMGRVFLADDPRLSRPVALKFVRSDAPADTRRFLFEARAQARVQHKRVCEVYEVGELDGKVYIAMQYIDGRPLSQVADELTLEHKVMIVRDAAEGVNAAHRVGLIHRDLKPSNIMVERSDGGYRPYVVDFGLARSFQSDLTMTGAVLGTPHFMAPEQARGDIKLLDRRTDVYGLGATLYAILTGELPIPGDNALEVLANTSAFQPVPPRTHDRDIPADLEAITLQCLHKDRADRYQSARALADDLTRFLDGEPVRVRSVGQLYRLKKRLRKHALAVTLAVVAASALLVALGWAIVERQQASERERLARRYTELVENVEGMARFSSLSPLHDIRADRRAIQAKMQAIEDEIASAGTIARGPGHYALGRGYLALDDHAKARQYLESAWRAGYREPRVAYALSLVYGRAYREALLAAENIRDEETRALRIQQARTQYRQPALAYLRQSVGADVPSSAYLAALIAFYEERLDDALAHLDGIDEALPWFYEAPKLRGDILLARGLSERNTGQRESAQASFQAGREAYEKAAQIGESAPAVQTALGELAYAELHMERSGSGQVEAPFARVQAAVKQALSALPEYRPALDLAARTHRRMAEMGTDKGEDVRPLLSAGVDYASRALKQDPERANSRLELARLHRQWGEYLQSRGQDPVQHLAEGLALADGIAPAERRFDFHDHVGLSHRVWADYLDQTGGDSSAHRGESIAAYRNALQYSERSFIVWLNLGVGFQARAAQADPRAAEADLEQALAALARARAIDSQHIASYFYSGEIHYQLAVRASARGDDPRPHLDQALPMYRGGAEINPDMPHFFNGMGAVLYLQAMAAWERGGDPDPLLERAVGAYRQALKAAPKHAFAYNNIGEAQARRAHYDRTRGRDPSAPAAAAIAALTRALELLPDDAGLWANLGMAHAIRAAHELGQGNDPSAALAATVDALERALTLNPRHAQAHNYLGEARAIRARYRARTRSGSADGLSADFEQALPSFEAGRNVGPERQDERLLFGHFYRLWAIWLRRTGQSSDVPLARGLALADALLAARPQWPGALLLRASLQYERAAAAVDADERARLRTRAESDAHNALASNLNLAVMWDQVRRESNRQVESTAPSR